MLYIMTDYQDLIVDYLTPGKFYRAFRDDINYPNCNLYRFIGNNGNIVIAPVGIPSAHLNDIGVFKLFEITEVEIAE